VTLRESPFRKAAIIVRHVARKRGIEGSVLGYFSPPILELLVLRSHTELEALGGQIYPADVAQSTINSLAEFDYIHFQWHVDGATPKTTPGDILEIYHPVQKKRILNPFTTNQTSGTAIEQCHNVKGAAHLEEFIQSTEDVVFFQFRYAIRIVLGPTFAKPTDELEVKCYQQLHSLLLDLAQQRPDIVFRAWPYTFSKALPDGSMETYFIIFCGKGTDVSEEEAWSRNGSGSEDFESQDGDTPAPLWIKGPGTHHRSGHGGSKGHSATERHQRAHASKKLVRESTART
jgi:hypothetical protein